MRLAFAKTCAALVPLALTTAAVAGAPQEAQAATAAYKLTYATMPNRTKVAVRWNGCQKAITYKVNVAAVPRAQRATILAETKTAVNQIAVATRFAFSYKGTTTEVPRVGSMPRQSAELVLAYTTPSKTNYNLYGSVLGEGGLYYAWASRTVSGRTTYAVAAQRGFVVIDAPDMLRRTRTGYGTGVRRTNLMVHELGHAMGLQHVSDTRQQMYPMLSSRSPKLLAWGDRAGLARVGRGAGCVDTTSLPLRDLS
jgi:hypothetical protein